MKGLQKKREVFGVTEYELANGLRVLHKEDTTSPVVGIIVTYHVGSRNEAVGHTGSTHILEHLLFKDSVRFNKRNGKSPGSYLEELGANMNATTWNDRTNYFELLPKEHAEEALALEADRMRHSTFSVEDLATEMTVVRNEYERGRNRPEEILEEAVWAAAFMAHPYHHPTIGWKEDIESATVERLRDFYDRFYYPNNATLAVFGDIHAKELIRIVETHFGRLPRSARDIPRVFTKEGAQTGKRTLTISYPGETSLAMLGYKAPEGRDASFPAHLVLSQIVAGGLASRLDDALVDTGHAVYVRPFLHAFHDPSLFTVLAQATPGTSLEQIISRIEKEFANVVSKGVTSSEVARAKEQITAALSYERDGLLNELYAVSEGVAAGDWTLNYSLEPAVSKITKKEVDAAARRMLQPEQVTIGTITPGRTKNS